MAGTLTYSGLTNYGKATLPSVDSWGTNMNILRDPPKSITTRKIDKVGTNNNITVDIDNSGDRICEAISTYARGVNPFVSTSYDNYGNNGGQTIGSQASAFAGRQAYLPYRVDINGGFRPPVVSREQLVPLSRQPRVWFDVYTKPGFVDFAKRMASCDTNGATRAIKTELTSIADNRQVQSHNVQFAGNTFEAVANNIKDITHNISASAGLNPGNILTNNTNWKSVDNIIANALHADAETNLSSAAVPSQHILNAKFIGDNALDGSQKYIHANNPHVFAQTNISSNMRSEQNRNDSSDLLFGDAYTQQNIRSQYSVNANPSITQHMSNIGDDVDDINSYINRHTNDMDFTIWWRFR